MSNNAILIGSYIIAQFLLCFLLTVNVLAAFYSSMYKESYALNVFSAICCVVGLVMINYAWFTHLPS